MSRNFGLMLVACAGLVGLARPADGAEKLAMPPPGSAPAPFVVNDYVPDAGLDAGCEKKCRPCLDKLKGWLCYRSTARDCKGCAPEPCCRPGLYAWFLHRCSACTPPEQPAAKVIGFSYTELYRQNGVGCGPTCYPTRSCTQGCR